MKRRKWDAKTKAIIVLDGLKGKSVATICQDHQISQAQYYQWRDQFSRTPPKRLRWRNKPSAKPGCNMRTPGLRSWLANSPWSSKKATRRCGDETPPSLAQRDAAQ